MKDYAGNNCLWDVCKGRDHVVGGSSIKDRAVGPRSQFRTWDPFQLASDWALQ